MLLPKTVFFSFVLIASAAFLLLVAAFLSGTIPSFRKKGILPFSPQSSVPWKTCDFVLLICLFEFFSIIALVVHFVGFLNDKISVITPEKVAISAPAEETEDEIDGGKVDDESSLAEMHPLVQMLRQTEGTQRFSFFLVAFLVAVIAAPIGEEFFYRGILQGSFQKYERISLKNWKRSSMFPYGFFSVMFASLWFAARHFRSADSPLDNLDMLLYMMIFQIFLTAFVLTTAIVYLCYRGVSLLDMGFDLSHWKVDTLWGVGLFMVVFLPIMAMGLSFTNITFADGTRMFPPGIADPISIFFFAIFLGLLYLRTHRLLPGIVLHASLNMTSLVFTILALDW